MRVIFLQFILAAFSSFCFAKNILVFHGTVGFGHEAAANELADQLLIDIPNSYVITLEKETDPAKIAARKPNPRVIRIQRVILNPRDSAPTKLNKLLEDHPNTGVMLLNDVLRAQDEIRRRHIEQGLPAPTFIILKDAREFLDGQIMTIPLINIGIKLPFAGMEKGFPLNETQKWIYDYSTGKQRKAYGAGYVLYMFMGAVLPNYMMPEVRNYRPIRMLQWLEETDSVIGFSFYPWSSDALAFLKKYKLLRGISIGAGVTDLDQHKYFAKLTKWFDMLFYGTLKLRDEVVRDFGIFPERVRVGGMGPNEALRGEFPGDAAAIEKFSAQYGSEKFGYIDHALPTFMMMGGQQGLGDYEGVSQVLIDMTAKYTSPFKKINLILCTGGNLPLRAKLEVMRARGEFGKNVNILIAGWLDQKEVLNPLLRYLGRTGGYFYSKSGGKTTTQGLAFMGRAIYSDEVPGQERGNATALDSNYQFVRDLNELEASIIEIAKKEVLDAQLIERSSTIAGMRPRGIADWIGEVRQQLGLQAAPAANSSANICSQLYP